MKKTCIKILSVVLCAVLMLGAAPLGGLVGLDLPSLFDFKVEAVSHSGTCGDNLTWSFDTETGVLNITGTGAMTNYSSSSSVPWRLYLSNIKTVNIASSVTTIGKRAFSGCEILTSITIPDSVTTIGDNAFYDCASLTSVTIPDSVTTIGDSAFYNCTNLTNIKVASDNKYYSNDSYGVLFNKDKTKLIQYPTGNARTSYKTPDSVTSISGYAFYNCDSLTSVTIGNSVTTIGRYAFYDCNSLTSVTIGNSVTTIDNSAFYNCTNLTSVTIGNSVTTIGYGAFSYCTSLTSVTIPDSVTTIGAFAFLSCDSLTSITIPGSVITIDYMAFFDCDSLTDVYYTGTKAQWKKIAIDSDNDPLKNATIHYNHAHALNNVIESVDPTCYKTGYKMSTCVCGYIFTEEIPALNHKDTLVKVAAKAPTCTEIGWDAYEYCTACDYTTYVEKAALKHDIIIDKAVEPTCTQTGLTEGQHCSRCDDMTVKQEVVPALNHKDTLVKVAAKAPTCTEIGWDAYEYCTACTYTTYVEKAALKHDIVIDKAVEPTCNKTGLTEGQHCSRCDDMTVKQEVVPALNHKDTLVKVAAKAPTCTEIGWDAYEYCTACTYTTYVEKAALKHDIIIDKAVDATCTETGLTEGQHCSRCDDATIKQEVVPVKAHNHTAKYDSARHWEECVCGSKINVQNHSFVGENVCSCGFKRTVDSTIKINNNNGSKTINYGETLKLMATVTDKPENAKIYWYVDGEQKGEGEIFNVNFESGTKIITVKLVDENGVVYQNANGEEISESENVTVNAGFFQKLISFFKNLFRIDRTVVQ